MNVRHIDTLERDRRERLSAMCRVFGGTALAFLTLLVVALLVRPDMMQVATDMVLSAMH